MTDDIADSGDDELPLDFPAAGDVLRTINGGGFVLAALGILLAVLGVVFTPVTGGFLDPAAIAIGAAPWFIGVGVVIGVVANAVEWARNAYRVEPVTEAVPDE